MSDDLELTRRLSRGQKTAQSSEFQLSENNTSEPGVQGVQQLENQEPEEISSLKDKIQELEQLVSIEEKRGREVLDEAKSSYKHLAPARRVIVEAAKKAQELEKEKALSSGEQLGDDFEEKQNRLNLSEKASKMQVQRELISKKNLIKELKRLPVAKSFESELEATKLELREAETKWQKQIASANTAAPQIEEQRAKLNASELDQAFGELEKAHNEMLKVNNRSARGSDKTGVKKAAEQFDKISAAFKKDFLRADPEDQKKTLDKAAQVSTLDKMSINVKKGLLIESGTKSAELEGKFAIKIQRLVAQKAREFSQGAHSGKKPTSSQQRDNSQEAVFNPMRAALSSFKSRAASESRNSAQALPPRVRKQDTSRSL